MRSLTGEEFAEILEASLPAVDDGDLIGLWWIAKLVEERIGGGAVAREQTLRVVATILAMGIRAGTTPYHPEGWQPWPDQEPGAVLARIRQDWMEAGETPNIPDSPWFGW